MSTLTYRSLDEYDDHSLVRYCTDSETGLEAVIAIHRQKPGIPALGATRWWQYDSLNDAANDALRLARLMSLKSASVDLPYTGAKAVIMSPARDEAHRHAMLKAYARHVDALDGAFVTGTDVGLSNADLPIMKSVTPHIIGECVDSGEYTADGVFAAMQVAIPYVFGQETLAGLTVAIQGVGKTGSALLKRVQPHATQVYVADINHELATALASEYDNVTAVPSDELLSVDVDILSPCALSGVVTADTITRLACKLIVGAANNQLARLDFVTELARQEICYIPDYLANAGGIISVVDQFAHGHIDKDRIQERITRIPLTLKEAFAMSDRDAKPVATIIDDIVRTRVYG